MNTVVDRVVYRKYSGSCQKGEGRMVTEMA